MKLIWINVGISDVAIKWLDEQAKKESNAQGASISRSDLIRRAIGEMRAKEMRT